MPLSEVQKWDLEDIDNALSLIDMKSSNEAAYHEFIKDSMKDK